MNSSVNAESAIMSEGESLNRSCFFAQLQRTEAAGYDETGAGSSVISKKRRRSPSSDSARFDQLSPAADPDALPSSTQVPADLQGQIQRNYFKSIAQNMYHRSCCRREWGRDIAASGMEELASRCWPGDRAAIYDAVAHRHAPRDCILDALRQQPPPENCPRQVWLDILGEVEAAAERDIQDLEADMCMELEMETMEPAAAAAADVSCEAAP